MTDFRKFFGNKIPVILDTDTANEADDQFAIVYSALSDNVDLLGVTVSPFSNGRERDTAKAVKMCYDEAKKFVALTGKDVPVMMGADAFLPDTKTAVSSESSEWIVSTLRAVPQGEKILVCIIGVATNVASALLAAPDIADKMIILWQAGHVPECPEGGEFNLCSDLNAGRVIFESNVPLVLLPAYGSASVLAISARELLGIKGGTAGDALYDLFCEYIGVRGEADMDRAKILWDIASAGVLDGCAAVFEEHPRRCRISDTEFIEGDGTLTVCRDIDKEEILSLMSRTVGGK